MKRALVFLLSLWAAVAPAQYAQTVNTPKSVTSYGRAAEQQRTTQATVTRVVDGDTLVLDTGEK